MIFVKNRKFYFSEEEDEIFAFDGDHNVKTVTFCLPTVDFQDYSFRLDLEKENGEKGIASLVKKVQEDRVLLFWKPQNSQLAPGNLKVQIRAFLADSTEVWHSEQTVFYVGESIGATSAYPAVLPTEFEEIEKRIAVMDERVSQNSAESSAIYEEVKVSAAAAAENAASAKESALSALSAKEDAEGWAQKSMEHAEVSSIHRQDAERYAKEAEETLSKLQKGADGFSPIVEIIPRENSNAYRFTKKGYQMSTVRWCDAADGDRVRRLEFSAKVECHVPHATHAWRIQVRKASGGDADLMRLGSDGAGNTVLYNGQGEKVRLLTPGWHDYKVYWNSNSGSYFLVADGQSVETAQSEALSMKDAHGLQIGGIWPCEEGKEDVISIDYFALYNDSVLRFSDNFNQSPVGDGVPDGWYQNDSYSENKREIFLVEDQEVYLLVTDAEGTKKSGNLKGEDAALREGSVIQEILADGAVGMDKLSPDVRALLEQISSLVATVETSTNGEG